MNRTLPEYFDPDHADHSVTAAVFVREEPEEEEEEEEEDKDTEDDDGNDDGYSE